MKGNIMLEWLKTILAEHYSEDIDKKVSEEIGKSFVARNDFNTVNTELKQARDTVKERDGQLEALKKSSDVEGLKKQITDLQEENKNKDEAHQAEIKQLKFDTALNAALVTGGNMRVKSYCMKLLSGRCGNTRATNKRFPNLDKLKADYNRLTANKNALRVEYGKLRREAKEYGIVLKNVNSILEPGTEQRARGKVRGVEL